MFILIFNLYHHLSNYQESYVLLADVKPSNILCNYKKIDIQEGDTGIRFSQVLLADFGSCVPATFDYANDGDIIGASIFRSPEANFRLPWGQSADIWSFGTTVRHDG
jgi:serine/threonine protein kinase